MSNSNTERRVFFTIPPGDRSLVAQWLTDVKYFFATTGLAAANVAQGFEGQLPQNNQWNNADSAHGDDMLEGATMHYAVHLSSVLGHYSEDVRVKAVLYLFALACIFDKRAIDLKKKLTKITLSFQTDDKGFHQCVHELFHYIGPSLSNMAIALVAGLECFFTSIDWSVRGICISALTRLVYENEKVFLEEDHLAAIYNLYFSLGSIPLISKIFPDRIVIIKALGLLSPLYSLADLSLTYGIIGSLMRLKEKTALETDAIKATLRKIFEKLSESPHLLQGASNATDPMKGHGNAIGFNMFLNLLTPNEEYSYDLLSWALENYALAMSGFQPDEKAKRTLQKEFPPLNDFIKSLANHFRATPALVRFGACICLHSAMNIYPQLVQSNKSLRIFIISGVLDPDYLSSFLYLTMLDTYCTNYVRPDVHDLITSLRHETRGNVDYDMLYATPPVKQAPEVTLSDILDIAIGGSPPLATKLLHKIVNSLEYLSKPAKLRQMELIRLWGSKMEKLDSYLMQSIVPLLDDSDEDMQLSTVKVVRALMPGFRIAQPADIAFIWSYFRTHMKPKSNSAMLKAVLDLVKIFPLDRLSDDSREILLFSLLELSFHFDPTIRILAYQLIGGQGDFWRLSSLFNAAIGILFLVIGDNNVQCAKVAIDYLCNMLQSTQFKSLSVPLGLLKDSLGGKMNAVIKAYDDLADFVEKSRSDLESLIESITHDVNVDAFWDFWLEGVADNQLVRPDEYNYNKNFIHSPFWVSLLLSKLSVPPPPPQAGEVVRRNMVPTTSVNRRRFFCGFMLCLLPTCGMPDPLFRKAACFASVLCCFRQGKVNPGVMRGLLEYVSQQMIGHKQWTFQLSGLDILQMLVRLKLPDVAFNSPSSMVKCGAIELIESFLLVFPNAVSIKLQDIRDVIRALLVDGDADVAKAASSIYPIVFKCVSSVNTKEFHDYLRNEINMIQKNGMEALSDPMLSGLSIEELTRVVILSIHGLGCISSVGTSYMIVQELLRLLHHSDPDIRFAALSSIITQLHNLDAIEGSAILWILLPMYADPSRAVRLALSKMLRKLPLFTEQLCKSISPHPDDSVVMNSASWEDLLLDGAIIRANSKNLNDIGSNLDQLVPPESKELPLDDDGFHIPTVSEQLLSRIKELAKVTTGAIPVMHIAEVMYHLNELQKNKDLQAGAIIVMSEFSCVHEATQNDVSDLLIGNLNHDLGVENLRLVEASVMGLKNMSEYSPTLLKQILVKLSTPVAVHEGDILFALYRIDAIREFCANKVPELLKRYTAIVVSQRHPTRKRLYAFYLSVELSLFAGGDEMIRVLDATQSFLESSDEDVQQKVYGSLRKILNAIGPKHTIFKSLLNDARKNLRSKNPSIRLKSLSTFRIFARHLSAEESMQFCFLLLADSSREVRRKAKEVLVLENLLEFVIPVLKTVKNYAGTRRAAVLDSCKLPSIQLLGVTINTDAAEEIDMSVPFQEVDPYNTEYYSSDRRRKFTSRYGLPEARFARACLPRTYSVLETIEERAVGFKTLDAEMQAKFGWLLNLDTVTILHECIKKYPNAAIEIIENGLAECEMAVENAGESSSDKGDVEKEIHVIDVLSNMLFAYDGIDDKVSNYIDRLQYLITSCNAKAVVARELLYADLENSFYFFNEFIDVPIVSEEQFLALEKCKQAMEQATLEVVKSGKTDQLGMIDNMKSEFLKTLDFKSEHLRRMTILALHGTSGFGLFYALSLQSSDAREASALQFLTEILENEHRGMRITAVEAITCFCKIQTENVLKPSFSTVIKNIIERFLARLVDENSGLLYRRKADIINLLAQLINYVTERDLRIGVLEHLVRMWRDPDSEVRITSIKMVQMLGESGISEVMEGFLGEESIDDSRKAPDFMQELASLLSNPNYFEKDHLNSLLTWRFSQGRQNVF